MPVYSYKCTSCPCMFDKFLRLANYQDQQFCPECHSSAEKQVAAPAIIGDYAPYQCPVTGKWIEGRKAHEENLKRTGCRILEPGESEAAAAARKADDEALDKAVEATTEQFIESLPAAKKEKLVAEVEAGLDVSFERV